MLHIGIKKAMHTTHIPRYFNIIVAFMLALYLLVHSGCSLGKPDNNCIAVVNGEKIYFDEFENKFKSKLFLMRKNALYDASQFEKLRKEFLEDMIDEKLMLNRARDLKIKISNQDLQKKIDEIKADYSGKVFTGLFKEKKDYQVWVEDLRKRLILEKLIQQEVNTGIFVTEEEAYRYFNSLPSGASEGGVHASQIVLPDREKAEMALKRLKNGDDFAALAREISTGPEASKGGDLGFFSRGVLPEQFDRVLFSLSPGKFSDIVETPYGFHIFKVLERTEKKITGFKDVKIKMMEKLRREKEEKAYETWLTKLRAGASITINQEVLGKAGQVQP